MEETGVPIENQQPVASHWQTLSHNVVHLALIEIRTHNICGDSIGSCKSNYCAITATSTPKKKYYGDVYNKLSKGTNKVAWKCIHKILKDVTIDCGKYFLYYIDYFYIVDQK